MMSIYHDQLQEHNVDEMLGKLYDKLLDMIMV